MVKRSGRSHEKSDWDDLKRFVQYRLGRTEFYLDNRGDRNWWQAIKWKPLFGDRNDQGDANQGHKALVFQRFVFKTWLMHSRESEINFFSHARYFFQWTIGKQVWWVILKTTLCREIKTFVWTTDTRSRNLFLPATPNRQIANYEARPAVLFRFLHQSKMLW